MTGLPANSPVVLRETFAPIVYALKVANVEEGIAVNNGVEQGLSSSLFTQNIGNIFKVSVWKLEIERLCVIPYFLAVART